MWGTALQVGRRRWNRALFTYELRGELAQHSAEAFGGAFEDSKRVDYWAAREQLAKLEEVWQPPRRPTEA